MKNLIQKIKRAIIWWRLRRYPVTTVTDKEFEGMKEGEPISAELALRVMQGDPDAIAELRGEKKEKVKN